MSARAAASHGYLVRHAKAGARERWPGPDQLRPLTGAGERQAERLHRALSAEGVGGARELRTSPYVRCRQTLEPLAAALRLPLVDDPRLAEGGSAGDVLALLAGGVTMVLCSHGDVIYEVLSVLEGMGLLGGTEARMEKGSTWVLRLIAGEVVGAHYVAPPG